METQPRIAEKLIFEILGITHEESLIIIFDQYGYKIADYCAEVATKANVSFCSRYIPRNTQQYLISNNFSESNWYKCLQDSDVLLFSVSDSEDCTKFRAEILKIAVNNNMKILHLPGVDLELFKEHLDLTNTHELIPTAEYYASYLENAHEIKIDTSNKKNSFSLTMNLDSNRRVFKEIGAVERGQIGQLPPGEVFVAPKEFTAEGEIIINGSAPQRVFREDDLILLSFSKGVLNLTDSRFSKTINGTCFEKELRDYESISKLNVTLGEFGIGINKNYRKLTGKPIRDEKVFGTCHIALGENSVFQGIIECESHIDLIFYPDEITIDGKRLPIIKTP